ncbi:MAG: HD domain-containing protein [bacterium]
MELLKTIEGIARKRAKQAGPAHDFSHVRRVALTASKLALAEAADHEITVAAALLHELFNYPKDHELSHMSGDVCAEQATEVLQGLEFPADRTAAVALCIREHSFSKGVTPTTLESRILQDSDRLDAMGAIGVARWAATCADMQRCFYDSEDPFCESREVDDRSFGVDHFYRKLLKLAEGLHTAAAHELARERLRFMKDFLNQLRGEIQA